MLLDKYLAYWPVFAGAILFLALGLWWRLTAARAMELSPKPLNWVHNYRSGGYPFRKEVLGRPKLRWWALLLVLVSACVLAAVRLANSGMIVNQTPEWFYSSRYGILYVLLLSIGAGSVYLILNILFDSPWAAQSGALLFAASPVRGHGDCCLLALALLLLLFYLRAEKPGFPAELLYLASCLALAPLLALRPALLWLLLCWPLLHWYKLNRQRREQRLSGGLLLGTLAASLAGWALTVLLTAALHRWLLMGFRTSALTSLFSAERLRYVLRGLALNCKRHLFTTPTRGMLVELLLDAPLLGFGFWGCFSAWRLGKKRRDVRGVFSIAVLAVLFLVWLLTGRYLLTLGLTLTAACILRDANLGKKRWICVLMAAAGVCWYILIQIAAWYIPLTAGLCERLV
ncbi:MAG: hypothetical protein IJG08_05205 [Oscillospiraceae bacterium]|nr:hypothetical protein [Oscillospiraceae bacterium]